MEIEELFCKRYPEYSVNGRPLSPYFDVFEEGYEQAETDKQYWEQKANRLTTEWGKTLDQLAKAKNLIENIIRVTWGDGWNYSLDWKVKAEQFIRETEK